MRESGSILGYASLPAFLAVLVALPFVASDQTPPGESASSRPSQDRPDRVASPSDARPFRMGRQLVARTMGVPCCDDLPTDSLQVLVALLPDPDQSSLDWNYDASLSAIRRALEAARYTSDRSWFPSTDSLVGMETAGESRTLPHPEAEPAVLVFRGEAGASNRNLAVVYVVGEIPTTGVHKEALRTALTEASRLAGDTLRLLGPTFSGTIPSLRAVLASLPTDVSRPHLQIISGSATAEGNRGQLLDGLESPFDSVTYGTTVHTDEAYRAALQTRILEPLALRGDEVALLTESNTGYGAAQEPDTVSGGAGGTPGEDHDHGPHSLAHALPISFPLNIAALRAEYDRNPADTAGGAFRLPRRSSRVPLSLQLRSRPLEVPPARSRLTAPAVDLVLADVLHTLQAHDVKAVGILASDIRDKIFLAGLVRRELPDALLFTFEGNALFLRPELARGLRGMVVVSTYPLILENAVWTGAPTRLMSFPAESAVGVFNATLFLLGRRDDAYQYRPPGVAEPPTGVPLRPPVWITTVGSGSLQPLAVATASTDGGPDPAVPLPRTASEPEESDEHAHAHPAGLLSIVALVTVVLAGLALTFSLLLAVPPWSRRRVRGTRTGTPGGEGDSGEDPSSDGRSWSERCAEVLGALVHDGLRAPGPAPVADWEDPDHLGWRVLDALAVAVALLAFVTPLAYLNGVAPPWEPPHHRLVSWTGPLAVVLLVAYTGLLVGWVARNAVRRKSGKLAPFVDLTPHVMAVLLGALGLLYWLQLRGLRVEGASDPLSRGDASVAFGLYRYRTLHLESATSGLLLFLLASIAVVVAVVWHANRRRILLGARPAFEYLTTSVRGGGEAKGASPEDHWSGALQEVGKAMRGVRRFLEGGLDLGRGAVIVLGTLAPIALALLLWWPDVPFPDLPFLSRTSLRTLDDIALDRGGWAATTRALWAGLALGFGFTAASAVHLLLVWFPFRGFLHALSSLPVAPALDRIPERLRTLGRLHLFDPPARKLGEAQAETGHEAVWRMAETQWNTEAFDDVREALDGRILDVAGLDSPRTRANSLRALVRALQRIWMRHPELALAGAEAGASGDGDEGGELVRWVRCAEWVVAVEVTRYVGWVLRNLRRIALLLLFTVLWTTAYLEAMPFPHHASMTMAFIVLTVLGIGAVVSIMAHLSQDDVISRINGTPPGKITWRSSSLLSAMVFVLLPVVGLLGTEIDPVGRVLFGWVSDILKVLGAR